MKESKEKKEFQKAKDQISTIKITLINLRFEDYI